MTRQELLRELQSVLHDEALIIAQVTQQGHPGVLVRRAVARVTGDGDEYLEDRVFCISIAEMNATIPS